MDALIWHVLLKVKDKLCTCMACHMDTIFRRAVVRAMPGHLLPSRDKMLNLLSPTMKKERNTVSDRGSDIPHLAVLFQPIDWMN